MDVSPGKGNPKRKPLTLLAGAYLAVLYIALGIIVFIFSHQRVAERNSPILTATISPTPHILVNPPSEQDKVLYENFSSNERDWGLYYQNGKIEVINGKLILQSNIPNVFAVGASEKISLSTHKYYIQADFSTDTATTSPYGLIFGFNRSLNTYYVFDIVPRGGLRLLKYNAGKWTDLIPYTAIEISPYPEATTLGVYFDNGSMKLYINGNVVLEYFDENFYQSKNIGVFVSNSDFRLVVDNFFVYDDK